MTVLDLPLRTWSALAISYDDLIAARDKRAEEAQRRLQEAKGGRRG